MLKFTNLGQGVFTFRPGVAKLVADVHPIFKAHLVLGMTILLVFPFTRLVHMLSAPIWYLNRRGWQLVRTKQPLPRRRVAAVPSHPGPAGAPPKPAPVQAVWPDPLKTAE